MNQIVGVIQAYNKERLRRGKRVVRYANPRIKSDALKLIAWCNERNIDPVNYVQVVAPLFKVLFPLYNLGNKERHKCYMENYHCDRENSYQHEHVTSKSKMKLRPAQEKFKSHYVDNQYLCLSQRQFNGGFNVESNYCRTCPYWQECKNK